MYRLAVLLTVFNRKEKTLQCLKALYKQLLSSAFVVDVFLVDDGCTDGTAEAIAKSFPHVTLIKGNGSLFWNRGMHLAWKTASEYDEYDYYLWLNDDTILFETALSGLVTVSLEKNNQSIVVGSTSATCKDELTYGGRDKNGYLIEPGKEVKECISFNGNVVLFPKYVFNMVGLNDPLFSHALGDFDYGLRARKLGIQSFVAPGYLGKCDVHDQLATWCNPKKSIFQRWKAFRTPLGQNPEQFFIFERRHNGLGYAVFHYFTNHLRLLMPQLWELKQR